MDSDRCYSIKSTPPSLTPPPIPPPPLPPPPPPPSLPPTPSFDSDDSLTVSNRCHSVAVLFFLSDFIIIIIICLFFLQVLFWIFVFLLAFASFCFLPLPVLGYSFVMFVDIIEDEI